MSTTMVQIRNIPNAVHRRLKARAATEGMTMSDFILREVRKALDRPSRQEMLDRLSARPKRSVTPSPARVIRAERDAR
jgi:plasmid stability protein